MPVAPAPSQPLVEHLRARTHPRVRRRAGRRAASASSCGRALPRVQVAEAAVARHHVDQSARGASRPIQSSALEVHLPVVGGDEQRRVPAAATVEQVADEPVGERELALVEAVRASPNSCATVSTPG